MKIKVLNKNWTVRFLSYKRFRKKHTNKVVGITLPYKKRIDLCSRFTDKEIIAHELTHAFINELCVSPANLDVDDLEEIFCDIIAKHAKNILRQTERIYARYRKVKK